MPFSIERYLNVRSATSGTFRPDGRRLAFLTDITGTYQVWAVDVPTPGHPTAWLDQLTFFKERVLGVTYSPVADEMIFSTDVGGNERAQLFLLSGDGQQLRQLTAAPQAIHSFGGWSHDGRHIAYSSNVGDPRVFDIYVMDVRSGEAQMVHPGDGWFYVVGFSPDDATLLIGKAYSSFNQDLWLLDLANGATRYLTPHVGEARYEAVFAPDGRRLYVASDLDRDFLTLAHMDLSMPDADGPAPPLVFRDSPGWDVSSLYVARQSNRLAYHINADGYTQLVIESLADGAGLSIEGLPPGVCELSAFSVDGLQAAITVNAPRHNPDVWVADLTTGQARQLTRSSRAGIPQASLVEPGLMRYASFDGLSIADAQRLAVYGGSYGGFMVLAALTEYPDLWAAGIDIVGIANFLTFLENTGPWRRDLRIAEYGDPEKDREVLERISPINHVQRIRAPLMVIHGANDPRVPVGEAEQIVAALRSRQVPVTYLRYEDEGHGLSKLANRLDAYAKMTDFLDEHLQGKS